MTRCIVPHKCSSATGRQMTVVIAGKNRSDVEGQEAIDFAKAFAQQQGFAVRGIEPTPTIYPVGPDGADDEVTLGKVALGLIPTGGYECEIKFNAPL